MSTKVCYVREGESSLSGSRVTIYTEIFKAQYFRTVIYTGLPAEYRRSGVFLFYPISFLLFYEISYGRQRPKFFASNEYYDTSLGGTL
jgi:hypothetical protein